MEGYRMKNKRYCIALGCANSDRKMPELSFFTLPKEIERRREWLTSIGRKDLIDKADAKYKSYVVCSKHFADSSIKIIRHLKPDAVPTNYLANQSQDGSCRPQTHIKSTQTISADRLKCHTRKENVKKTDSMETQTEVPKLINEQKWISTEQIDKTTKNRKFENHPEYEHRPLDNKLKKIDKELDTNYTPIILTDDLGNAIDRRFSRLIKGKNKIKDKFKVNRYDEEYKEFLNLYYSNPKAYRYLRKITKLPSKSTMKRFKLKIPSKLEDRILNSLILKLEPFPDKAKYCTICVNEMVLKQKMMYDVNTNEVIGFPYINGEISPEIASNVYIIMLQGIYCNWKQPLAYALLATTNQLKELDLWIDEVIANLSEVGIKVKAIITDQSANFNKFAKEIKKIAVDKPYFFVDKLKIYYIFDISHLLRCVRDNLLSNNFYHKGDTISWEYIKILFEDQKEKTFKLIPKITEAHIEPKGIKRMQIKYIAQIFSYSVSAALETYIVFEKIPKDARPTARFINTMNNVFDILNSTKVKPVKDVETVLRITGQQKKILEDAQNLLANIKSIKRKTGKNDTKMVKTFNNFQITIQSMRELFLD